MIYLKDKNGKLFDADFRQLSISEKDLNKDLFELKSYEEAVLTKKLNEKYKESQQVIIKGDIEVSLPLSGEGWVYLQKIIDRSKCEDSELLQEYHFTDSKGDTYYTVLHNYLWNKLFGDLTLYSAANRRLKISVEQFIHSGDYEQAENAIGLFKDAISIDIEKLITMLSASSDIPKYISDAVKNSGGIFFRKIDSNVAVSDIEDLLKKYSI